MEDQFKEQFEGDFDPAYMEHLSKYQIIDNYKKLRQSYIETLRSYEIDRRLFLKNNPDPNINKLRIDAAIHILKTLGYKISKPVEKTITWEEI